MNEKVSKLREEKAEAGVPADLRRILATTTKAQTMWRHLTPIARRDFISWIDGAKKFATRTRRIERVPEMLLAGKRRPCCYALVPMNLYKALSANRKAKATWKGLTPAERRDAVSWLGSA